MYWAACTGRQGKELAGEVKKDVDDENLDQAERRGDRHTAGRPVFGSGQARRVGSRSVQRLDTQCRLRRAAGLDYGGVER